MKSTHHSVWRSSCGNYTVAVTKSCFDAIEQLARAHYPNEVGTALAGDYSDDGYHATVTGLAPLTTDSRGARTTFHRGERGLFAFFRDLFRSSRGMVHYVGDWHSHPEGAPIPSGADSENALAIARDQKALCPECILLILGVRREASELGVYIYSRIRGRIDLHRVDSPARK